MYVCILSIRGSDLGFLWFVVFLDYVFTQLFQFIFTIKMHKSTILVKYI